MLAALGGLVSTHKVCMLDEDGKLKGFWGLATARHGSLAACAASRPAPSRIESPFMTGSTTGLPHTRLLPFPNHVEGQAAQCPVLCGWPCDAPAFPAAAQSAQVEFIGGVALHLPYGRRSPPFACRSREFVDVFAYQSGTFRARLGAPKACTSSLMPHFCAPGRPAFVTLKPATAPPSAGQAGAQPTVPTGVPHLLSHSAAVIASCLPDLSMARLRLFPYPVASS
eukprot:gene5552-5530_t